MYKNIFISNINRIKQEKDLSFSELSRRCAISVAFLTDIFSGKGNPSLEKIEVIAAALETPLPYLFSNAEKEFWDQVDDILSQPTFKLPPGFVNFFGILSESQAKEARLWYSENRSRLRKAAH